MSATTDARPRSGRALSASTSDRAATSRQDSGGDAHQPSWAAAGSPVIDADTFLSDLFAAYVDAATTLPRYVALHPLLTVRAMRALRALPVHDAVLPPTAEAAALRGQLLQHAHSRRIMLGVSAVLEVSPEPGSDTVGRHRATMRRKIRAAEKQGVTIRPVRDDERTELLSIANRHELTNERDDYRIDQPDNDDLLDYALWLVALDRDGRPIMLSVTPTAGEWGVLRYSRTLVQGQASSDARYLMAREVAEALRARGVRHLVDSSRPHWLPNGLRHFQRMVGFRLVRVHGVEIAER